MSNSPPASPVKTTTSDPPKPFRLDLNLDDEVECRAFFEKHRLLTAQDLAKRLDLQGSGAVNLASALMMYASHKIAAFDYRLHAYIVDAIRQESQCDFIYRTNIQPVCDCW